MAKRTASFEVHKSMRLTYSETQCSKCRSLHFDPPGSNDAKAHLATSNRVSPWNRPLRARRNRARAWLDSADSKGTRRPQSSSTATPEASRSSPAASAANSSRVPLDERIEAQFSANAGYRYRHRDWPYDTSIQGVAVPRAAVSLTSFVDACER